MSFPTTSVFMTETKGWDQIRVHPTMVWMEDYTRDFDARKVFASPLTEWHTADFTLRHYNGTEYPKGEASFEGLKEMYAPFVKTLHYPKWLIVWETKDGWGMTGIATLYADLPVPGGEKQHTDPEGNKWDLGSDAMFKFEYVKDSSAKHGGLLLKSSSIYADSGAAMAEMLKRGMIKPEQLLG